MKIIQETERLYFREILETDDHHILELDADPEVHEFLGKHPISSIDQARATIKFIRQQYADHGIGRLAIIEKATHNFIGWGGFKLITDTINGHTNYYDLGYRLLKRYWGIGYATESSKAALAFAFDDLDISNVYAMTDAGNLSSQQVLKKCGFEQKEAFLYDATPHYWFELNLSPSSTLITAFPVK